MTKTIKPANDAHALALSRCPIKAARVEDMIREECAALMSWCDCQHESLWDDMTLQEILNVYRVSAEWDTWEGWREEEFDDAGRAWNRAVINKSNKLDTRASVHKRRAA